NKIFIARDFFGEKPLYYANLVNEFVWASELKSIIHKLESKPKIDIKGLNLYFRLTYIPAPYTIYEGIHKLEPNHYITYDLDHQEFSITEIEDTVSNKGETSPSLKEAKQKVRDLVYESVSSRSISDVPLGTFLSGGVDSSVVSLCLSQDKSSPIETFSIGF